MNIIQENKINKLYDKLTYFDQYGLSVIIFILLTILLIIAYFYSIIMLQIQPIKNDWQQQRCNPKVIPFAGLINKPNDKSIAAFTQENFIYCTQNILTSLSSYALQPLTFLTASLNVLYGDLSDDIQSGRSMFDNVRNNISIIVKEIMGRIINSLVPIQQIIIGFKDIMSKVQGILISGLFTSFGTYETLRSLLGTIVQLIINTLIALVVIIASMWVIPFTWGIASSMTAIFISISIPLAILVIFMTKVLHIHSNSIPKIPSKPRLCFDEDTNLKMNNGTTKKISEIEVGDNLEYNNIVTSKIKLCANNIQMYNLYGVIVSDKHIVYYNDKWIHVRNHPHAVLINSYNKPYIYCLNTSIKTITINNVIFSDWDDLYDNNVLNIINNFIQLNIIKNENYEIKKNDIHKYLDSGFHPETNIMLKNGNIKHIKDIIIGDILKNDEKVYGLVEIEGTLIYNQYEYDFDNNTQPIIGSSNLLFYNNKSKIMSTNMLNTKYKQNQDVISNKLYQLLTHTGTYYINNIIFYDYNGSIDLILKKTI
jgi:hypothetical protein